MVSPTAHLLSVFANLPSLSAPVSVASARETLATIVVFTPLDVTESPTAFGAALPVTASFLI